MSQSSLIVHKSFLVWYLRELIDSVKHIQFHFLLKVKRVILLKLCLWNWIMPYGLFYAIQVHEAKDEIPIEYYSNLTYVLYILCVPLGISAKLRSNKVREEVELDKKWQRINGQGQISFATCYYILLYLRQWVRFTHASGENRITQALSVSHCWHSSCISWVP